MSAMGDKNIDERDKRRKFRGKEAAQADWARVDAATLCRCVASVARAGGALRLGYSRDGSVFAIGVLGDGDPYTLWERDAESVDITLAELAEYFDDMEVPPPMPSKGRKRA